MDKETSPTIEEGDHDNMQHEEEHQSDGQNEGEGHEDEKKEAEEHDGDDDMVLHEEQREEQHEERHEEKKEVEEHDDNMAHEKQQNEHEEYENQQNEEHEQNNEHELEQYLQQQQQHEQEIPRARIIQPDMMFKYHPFIHHVTDESDKSYRRNYDMQCINYLKTAEIRTAYQLALGYVSDANLTLGQFVKELTGNEIVLLDDQEEDNPIHMLFVDNCISHLNVHPSNFLGVNLEVGQILIVPSGYDLSPESVEKIKSFVGSGGVILSFNKGISVIDKVFPQSITYKKGETSVDKKIEVEVVESDDKHLFLGLDNFAKQKKSIRFAGMRRFEAQNSSVEVLAKENGATPCPLAIKIKTGGDGCAFHVVHVGTDEVLELKSKEKAEMYCKQVQTHDKISEPTKIAWQTAFSCGQWRSFYTAISLLPFLDIIFGIINKYTR